MIWIIGGTHECRWACDYFKASQRAFILTVTTASAKDLYDYGHQVVVGNLSLKDMEDLIEKHGITHILDMSHPHATQVKQNAQKASKKMGIFYLQCQRKVEPPQSSEFWEVVSSVDHAIEWLLSQDQKKNILVTGCKHLDQWTEAFPLQRLYFRIMPTVESLKLCDAYQVPLRNRIAIAAPCSPDFNQMIFKEKNIAYFVFKNSGLRSAFPNNCASLISGGPKGVIIHPEYTQPFEGHVPLLTYETRASLVGILEKW